MLVLIMVDVVPTNISSYLDPKTFVKTVLTCKTLYDKKSLHEISRKNIYVVNTRYTIQ